MLMVSLHCMPLLQTDARGVVRGLLAAGCDKDKANAGGSTPLCIAAQEGHEGVVRELLAGFCDVSSVVTLEGHDNLKVLFREHFQHLFLAFVMAWYTRLGSEVPLAQEHCLLKDVVGNVNLLQMVLEQGLSLSQ